MDKRPKIVVFGGQKGGTGKTTMSVNLAAMCAMAGQEVLIVDTDRQESASTWAAARTAYLAENDLSPDITCVSKTGKVGYDLEQLSRKFDVIVVDCGGWDSIELRQSMAACDVIVLTSRPSQFDTWSLDKMAMLVQEMSEKLGEKINAKLLLNAVSTNPSVKEADEVRQLVTADYADEFAVMNCQVGDRIAFRRAARDGLSVMELPRNTVDANAMDEMQRLYKEIFNDNWTPAQRSPTSSISKQARKA